MNMNIRPKTKNASKLQKWFRSKRFVVDQYWKITYTLYKNHAAEDIYVSVIKARSFDFAKQILTLKLNEDKEDRLIKNIKGCMFHGNFHFNRSSNENLNKITIEDWHNVRSCAFPNENNHLFKFHLKYISPQEISTRNKIKLENFA